VARTLPPAPLKTTVCLGLIAGLLLSPRLWLSGRSYPLSPAFSFLHPIPPPFDFVVFGVMILLLLLISAIPRPGRWIAIFVPLAAAYALFDQSRWQPWFYQYLFMLAAIGLHTPDTCRLIIVSIYFWSGIQKLNSGFLYDTFPWMLNPFVSSVPAALAVAAALTESLIGVGLVIRKSRRLAVVAVVAMHVFILVSIGPFGHNSNRVVWPWNIAMILSVILLFWRTPDVSARDVVWGEKRTFQVAVLLVFTILPAFSLVDLWDSYLSFSLYSGNQRQATIYMADWVADRLPERLQEVVALDDSEWQVDTLDVEEWSYDELNVPPYAETRVLKNIGRRVCSYAGNPRQMVLAIEGKRVWFHRRRMSLYACDMLQR
jgi:uncharacterized membrane protein YphA (DoxX/SURF4 family)